jgi:DNA-3-methyladenine glycosylase
VTRGSGLARSFYDRDARVVAPELLNKLLVSGAGDGRLAARIVEVEAYCGADDPGSHAFRGPTTRNATMFGPPGHWYVYFTYGMHWCMNAVCGPATDPHAVLLRAAAPLTGLDVMRARRVAARRDRDLCSGPARLAQAFGVDRSCDGADIVTGELRIVDDGTPPPERPGISTRIGLGTGRGDDLAWRFAVVGEPNLSRPAGPPAGPPGGRGRRPRAAGSA